MKMGVEVRELDSNSVPPGPEPGSAPKPSSQLSLGPIFPA